MISFNQATLDIYLQICAIFEYIIAIKASNSWHSQNNAGAQPKP
jgi:hypothetical protein